MSTILGTGPGVSPTIPDGVVTILLGPSSGFSGVYFEHDLQSFLAANLSMPVYPDRIVEKSMLPCYVRYKVLGDSDYNLNGFSGLATFHISLSAYAYESDTAMQMDAQARYVLNGFAGIMGLSVVQLVTCQEQPSSYIEPKNESDRGTYVYRTDFYIIHNATVNNG